jgi:protein TonB
MNGVNANTNYSCLQRYSYSETPSLRDSTAHLSPAWTTPPSRIAAAALVVLVHVGFLGVLSINRLRAPEPPQPSMVTVDVSVEPVVTEPPSAPAAPARPRVQIDFPMPELAVATPNAITIPPAIEVAPPSPTASAPLATVADVPVAISTVEYVRPPEPRYPNAARAAREEGLVLLRVVVDERGRARDVGIVKSSGHVRLDDAAVTAVRRALFKPYVDNGVPRVAVVTVPIEFAIRQPRSSLAQR